MDGDGDTVAVVDMGADEWVNNPPNAPTSLLCEGVTNPTGVTDPTPEFSWTFSDPDAGDTQEAYQILVASTSENLTSDNGDTWDSGKVSSSAGEVSYAGLALAENQTYYWKVKTWDNHDAEGFYCAEQQFTTGTSPSEVWVDDGWAGSSHGDLVDGHTFGTDAFANIQDGIDAVAEGGTINVHDGTYTENVDVNRSLTIQSVNGADVTTVEAVNPDDYVFKVTANNVTITEFTVQGATGVGKAGIYLYWADHCNISDNIVTNNYWGICLYMSSNNTLTNNNTFNNQDFGITLGGGNSNIVTNNTAEFNGFFGISLHQTSSNTLTGNTASNNGSRGISLSSSGAEPCSYNRLENNTIHDNSIGITLYNSTDNQILGNDIRNNTGAVESESGIWLGGTSSGNAIHFNNIVGNSPYGVYSEATEVADATLNWWGDTSGPGGVGPGTGDAISVNVDYDPWLGTEVAASKTEIITVSGTLDVTEEADTEVEVDGSAAVTVAEYAENPGTGFTDDIAKYIDVHIDDATDVNEIEIRLYYTDGEISGLDESSLKLQWWDGSAWVECSDTGVDTDAINSYSGYIWAKIRSDTTPTLADLTGTPFGAAAPALSPPPSGGGGSGGAPPLEPGKTSVAEIITPEGRFTEGIVAVSDDGVCELTIAAGTIGLKANGVFLYQITMFKSEEPPATPEDSSVIGLVYDLGPKGATFNPPISLAVTYDPESLPEGIAEDDLYIAYWDGSQWLALESTVDTEAKTVSAKISHFTQFAVIGKLPPPPPPPARFSILSFSVSPSEVEPAEEVTVSAIVTNTGGSRGKYIVVLKIDGVEEARKEMTVDAGSSTSITFTVTREKPGSYTVIVDGLSGTFAVKAPPTPAAFAISTLTISPAVIDIGERVTISVALTNTGDLSGSYELALKIDNIMVAAKKVTLAGGASQKVPFITSKDVAGTYTVNIDGLSGTFIVKAMPLVPVKPINWWLITAGCVVAGLLVYFLVWRKRGASKSSLI